MLKSFIFSVFISLTTNIYANNINLDTDLKKDKVLMVYLHRVGCSYCNAMDEFTLDDDKIIEYIQNNFIYKNINITTDKKITFKNTTLSGLEFAKKIGYNFYPSILFLDKNAKVIYASVGYKDEKDLMTILKYIKNKKYNNMTFNEYKNTLNLSKYER